MERGGAKQVKPVLAQAPTSDRWGRLTPARGPEGSWSVAAPPLGLTNPGTEKHQGQRASYLDTSGRLSFDPHPIDQLALNCLLIEGVALCRLPSTLLPFPLPVL